MHLDFYACSVAFLPRIEPITVYEQAVPKTICLELSVCISCAFITLGVIDDFNFISSLKCWPESFLPRV